jgi:hypothetical protein
MASRLTLPRDREADILHITSRRPYPEQDTEELGHDDIIAQPNPDTGDAESLEILSSPHGSNATARSSCR